MSASYTKLASSILTSTIWMEDDHTRIVWFALMAMADHNGEVQASIPGLANIARVPIESCRAAIAKFMAPDPDSRTKDDEGRRVEEIKGGWLLINHSDYRDLASGEDRKRKAAERQQRRRDRKDRNKEVTHESRPVTPRHAPSRPVAPESRQICQSEAEAEAEASKGSLPLKPSAPASPPRARNELMDALVAIDGADPKEVTKPAWSAAASAMKDIKSVCPLLTTEEIQRRARNYRTNMPGAKITPKALAKHWADLDKETNHDSNHARNGRPSLLSPSSARNANIAGHDEWKRDADAADAAAALAGDQEAPW